MALLDRPPDNTTDPAAPPANFDAPRPWRHIGTIAAAIVANLSHRDRSGKAPVPRLEVERDIAPEVAAPHQVPT